MSNLAYERLHANLVKLKLNTVGTILDNYLQIAAKVGVAMEEKSGICI